MNNRNVLVTGAARGIGAAIAERLTADGWNVHAVDVEDGDLTTREGNRAVVDAALERFDGRLDAVVANAGFQHVAPLADFPEDRWDALLALLLTSPFLLAKYAWEALAASGDGRFLVVASVHGLVASPFKAGYVAAKHGVVGLVKVLALEGAEVGISASALCPAYVRTEIVRAPARGPIRRRPARPAGGQAVPRDGVVSRVLVFHESLDPLQKPPELG